MNITPIVRDFMDKSFITFTPDMNMDKVIDLLFKQKITGAGVVDKKEKLVGVITEKDCLRFLVDEKHKSSAGSKVSDYMTKNVITIHPNLDIFSTACMFFKHVFRRLLVLENEQLVGQITRRDLLRSIKKINLPK